MALSPREIPPFFAGNLPPSARQECLRGPINLQGFPIGSPNILNFNFQNDNTTKLPDHNITFFLQNWLLNSLRGISGAYPPISDPSVRHFPAIPTALSPVNDQQKNNFFLQDLNDKYRKLFNCSLNEMSEKHRTKTDTVEGNFIKNQINPAVLGRQFFPSFPNFTGNLHFPFPPSTVQKSDQRILISPFPNPFGPILEDKDPGELRTTTTIHGMKAPYPKNEIISSQKPRVAEHSLKDKKSHKCIYCGKLYSRKYGLKIHIRTHTGYKPLKCKVCGRPFGDPSNLNKHVRLHAEGDTPYRCEFCGKVLVRRRDLERHIKSRHPNSSGKVDAYTESWKISP